MSSGWRARIFVASVLRANTGRARSIHSTFSRAARMRSSPVDAAARKRCRLQSVGSPTSAANALANASERAASSRRRCSAPGAPRLTAAPSPRRTLPPDPSRSTRAHSALADFMIRRNSSAPRDAPLAQRAEERSLLVRRLRQPMRLRALAALQPVLDRPQQPIGLRLTPETPHRRCALCRAASAAQIAFRWSAARARLRHEPAADTAPRIRSRRMPARPVLHIHSSRAPSGELRRAGFAPATEPPSGWPRG